MDFGSLANPRMCNVHARTLPTHLRPNIDGIDGAVRSKVFWCTVRAVSELVLQCEYLGRWAEGCWCHEALLTQWAAEQAGEHSNATLVLTLTAKALQNVAVAVAVAGGLEMAVSNAGAN